MLTTEKETYARRVSRRGEEEEEKKASPTLSTHTGTDRSIHIRHKHASNLIARCRAIALLLATTVAGTAADAVVVVGI